LTSDPLVGSDLSKVVVGGGADVHPSVHCVHPSVHCVHVDTVCDDSLTNMAVLTHSYTHTHTYNSLTVDCVRSGGVQAG